MFSFFGSNKDDKDKTAEQQEAPKKKVYIPNPFSEAQDAFPFIVIETEDDGQDEQPNETNRFCNVM